MPTVKPWKKGDPPIRTVDGVKFPYIPAAPGGYSYQCEDVSKKGAGRVEDVDITMYKKRIGQVEKITLTFEAKTLAEAHGINNFFQKEYVNVEYVSPLAGGYITKEMYVGNRSCEMEYGGIDMWGKIRIPLITRKGKIESY